MRPLLNTYISILLGCSLTAALGAESYLAVCKKKQDALGGAPELFMRQQPYTYQEAKQLCEARNMPLDYISR